MQVALICFTSLRLLNTPKSTYISQFSKIYDLKIIDLKANNWQKTCLLASLSLVINVFWSLQVIINLAYIKCFLALEYFLINFCFFPSNIEHTFFWSCLIFLSLTKCECDCDLLPTKAGGTLTGLFLFFFTFLSKRLKKNVRKNNNVTKNKIKIILHHQKNYCNKVKM